MGVTAKDYLTARQLLQHVRNHMRAKSEEIDSRYGKLNKQNSGNELGSGKVGGRFMPCVQVC
jgi:hypothetical protein